MKQITSAMASLLQFYIRTKAPHTECRVHGLCKSSLDSVQETHASRDTVKCKCSCCMIQVDANPTWRWSWDVFAFVVVHIGEFGVRAVQTPGHVVPTQAALVAISFTPDSLVGDAHIYLCSLPVHLPVTATPTHTVPAQHLEVEIKRQSPFE